MAVGAACSGAVAPPVADPLDAAPPPDEGGLSIPEAGTPDAGTPGDGSSDAVSDDATRPDAAVPTCALPKVVGPCTAAIPRWWFDAVTGRCQPFVYGGCGGNGNNFVAPVDCAKACAPGVADPCKIIGCPAGEKCLYDALTPVCVAPCLDGGRCPLIAQRCGCGASCPGCRDCQRVCLP